jgi:pimeloyl-ACP methyl ester carboxylesterase
MATFVLVHGALCGGWCWKRVTPLLRAAGHEVYVITLTGLGERAHLAHPEIDLDTHIQDIVKVIDYEELIDVVLVGHSYGGMVISGVAELVAPRLAHLVYLDARIPRDGETMRDGFAPDMWTAYMTGVRTAGDGWRVPVPDLGPHPWGITDPDDVRWVLSKLTPQPLATWVEPMRLGNQQAAGLPRTFIHCTEGSAPHVSRARGAPGWQFLELATGHMAMITAPRELADLLLGAAQDA